MASELRVDTLKDASGANSIGLSYVANGSAKAWVHFDATSGTPVAQDSLNNSSITDGGVGNFTISFTSNMNNDDFFVSVGGGSSGASNRNASVDGIASSNVQQLAYNNSNSQIDMLFNFTGVHGDLA